ncbi:hypothetical protein RKLH11_3426 [Rhodobacteraceae bacterium KLH11]|nr:hypothetical protein RKLH11_3426 [Rhodobacteraceae bacterium KLH11]
MDQDVNDGLSGIRKFNSHVAAVVYPGLCRYGQLLETRLIENACRMNEGTRAEVTG